jgi:thiol-disulfide isomerase/thioredoxin
VTLARFGLALALAFGGACGPPPPSGVPLVPTNAHQIDISMHGIDCLECATALYPELKRVGAYDVAFDRKRAVLHISANPAVPAERFIAVIKDAGWGAELGDKGGSYLPQETFPKGGDVTIARKDGQDVADLAELAVPGKVTVIDFYALWCKPCRDIDYYMSKIIADRSDVAYRKLDVVDWDSPLAVHHLNGVPTLPYVVIYSKAKTRVDAISGLDLKRLDQAIDKGSTPAPPPPP